MKNLKTILAIIALATTILSCSKDDPAPAVVVPPVVVVVPQSVASTHSNESILTVPDATVNITSPGSATSIITVNKSGIIADPSKVSIEINLEGTWCGEVVVELISPSGSSVGLLKRMGFVGLSGADPAGDSSNFDGNNTLTFNSLSTTQLPFEALDASSAFVFGNYAPTGFNSATLEPINVLMTPLNTFFQNKNIEGNWKLKIYDMVQTDINKLISWRIKFDTGALK